MDDKTENKIPEYLKTLPKSVQDFVLDGEWEKRTLEIAKKYSLDDTKAGALSNVVVLLLIGLEKPETFTQTIVTDVGVSSVLAEQITTDVEKRVFEYALSQLESQTKPVSNPTTVAQKTPTTETPSQKSPVIESKLTPNIPEVRPVTTPMVENQPKSVPTNTPPSSPVPTPAPKYVPPAPVVTPPNQQVQRPVPVPRFTAVPMTEEAPAPVTPVNVTPKTVPQNQPAQPTQNPIDNKLNNVVKASSQTPPQQKLPEKYSVDPYREPIN